MSTYDNGGNFKLPKIFWIISAIVIVLIIIVIIFYQIQLGKKNKKVETTQKVEVTKETEIEKVEVKTEPIISYQTDPNNKPCDASTNQNNTFQITPIKTTGGYYSASLYGGQETVADCKNGEDVGIFVTSPKPYRKVYKSVAITGFIDGKGWTAPDGIVGTATLFSKNKKQLSVSFPVVATTDWETSEKISFSSKVLYTEKTTESLGYVEIVHVDPISNQKYIHRVTVSF